MSMMVVANQRGAIKEGKGEIVLAILMEMMEEDRGLEGGKSRRKERMEKSHLDRF